MAGFFQIGFGFILITIGSQTTPSAVVGVLMLTEAVFLSQFGGIVGVILGILGGNIVAVLLNVPAVIPMDWAFYGLAVCSVIGIGFGIYPAWRAANLDPIESLRYE